MEKLRFAIQVLTFTMALPVYFYLELGHQADKVQEVTKKQTSVDMKYTKNGKDRTVDENANVTYQNNPIILTTSSKTK